jgi:hypothetical protein
MNIMVPHFYNAIIILTNRRKCIEMNVEPVKWSIDVICLVSIHVDLFRIQKIETIIMISNHN